MLTQIALAQIALADRPSAPRLPPCLSRPIGLIALLACAGAPGKAKGGVNSETACEPCHAGKHSSNGAEQSGSSSCTYCAPGEYSGSSASYCPLCAAGKYSVGVMGTSQGGDGDLEKGKTGCAPCASGKYSPSTGRSSCLPCANGTWSAWSVSGTSSCTPCEGCAAGTTRGG